VKEFCPSCGIEQGPFIKGLCLNCFKEKKELVIAPIELKLDKCKHCQNVLISGVWKSPEEENLIKFVEKKVKIIEILNPKISTKIIPLEEEKFNAKIIVEGVLDSIPLVIEKDILLNSKITTCTSCSKVFGNYFEAIIQIRVESKDKTLIDQKIAQAQKFFEPLKNKNSLAQIVKIVGLKNGVDLYVGSNSAAKKVVGFMENTAKGKVVLSTTLHGFDKRKGKSIYRNTYCLRF